MVTFLLGVGVYQYMTMDDFTETEAQNSYRVYHPFTFVSKYRASAAWLGQENETTTNANYLCYIQ